MPETGLLVLFRFLLIFFFCFSFTHAQEYPNNNVNELLKSGIEKIINQNYGSATDDFTRLDSKYPELPFGKIYLAAVEIARAYDYGEEYNAERINNLLNNAEEECEKLEKNEPDNIWNNYLSGLTKGYISYYQALNGSWLKSLKEAVSSSSSLEKCIKKDPYFFEAYSGLGSYKYWKSKKTKMLNWLPFMGDEREAGISLLEDAVEKSFYNTYLAVNSLIWIYIDKKYYQSAIRVAEKALKKYPSSRFFKWGIARAYEDVDPKKAIVFYNEILNSYPDLSSMNKYNEIVLKHLMAQQYVKIGEKDKALLLCNEILGIKKLNTYVTDKLGDRLDRVKDLRKKILQKG